MEKNQVLDTGIHLDRFESLNFWIFLGMQAFSSESPEQFSIIEPFPCLKNLLEKGLTSTYEEKIWIAMKIEKHFEELAQLVQQSGQYLI